VTKYYFIFIFFLLISSAQCKNIPPKSINELLINYIEERGFIVDDIMLIDETFQILNFKLDSINCYYDMNRCRVDIYDDFKIKMPVWYYVKTKSKASFTNRNLYKGNEISRQDINVKYGNNFRCGYESNTIKELHVGKVNSNRLKKDMVICKSDVSPISSILKGSDIKLISTFSNILLEVKVRAISSGSVGDEINVLVKSSGKIIKAKVISNNTAEYIN